MSSYCIVTVRCLCILLLDVARQTQAYLYLALGIRELSLCMYTERKGGGQVLRGLGSSATTAGPVERRAWGSLSILMICQPSVNWTHKVVQILRFWWKCSMKATSSAS